MQKQEREERGRENFFLVASKALVPYIISGMVGAIGTLLATFRTMEIKVITQDASIEALRLKISEIDKLREDSESIKLGIANASLRIDAIERDLERYVRSARSGRR